MKTEPKSIQPHWAPALQLESFGLPCICLDFSSFSFSSRLFSQFNRRENVHLFLILCFNPAPQILMGPGWKECQTFWLPFQLFFWFPLLLFCPPYSRSRCFVQEFWQICWGEAKVRQSDRCKYWGIRCADGVTFLHSVPAALESCSVLQERQKLPQFNREKIKELLPG